MFNSSCKILLTFFFLGVYSLSYYLNTTISSHNFIDFVELNQRQVYFDVGHVRCSLGLQSTVYTIRNNAHEIENAQHRPLSTTYSTQSEVFKFNEKFHIDPLLVIFVTHCYRHEKKTSLISNLYRKNTTTATKMCFCTGIVDSSNHPTLHSTSILHAHF